ncbi:MAG: hypothetical protein NT007_17495 [Candidatus Kapabacteria bacterium]|nr:hypothetical protein [Candidatus Kapabacteria bacterium]
MSPYSYAGNSPLIAKDPSGLAFTVETDLGAIQESRLGMERAYLQNWLDECRMKADEFLEWSTKGGGGGVFYLKPAGQSFISQFSNAIAKIGKGISDAIGGAWDAIFGPSERLGKDGAGDNGQICTMSINFNNGAFSGNVNVRCYSGDAQAAMSKVTDWLGYMNNSKDGQTSLQNMFADGKSIQMDLTKSGSDIAQCYDQTFIAGSTSSDYNFGCKDLTPNALTGNNSKCGLEDGWIYIASEYLHDVPVEIYKYNFEKGNFWDYFRNAIRTMDFNLVATHEFGHMYDYHFCTTDFYFEYNAVLFQKSVWEANNPGLFYNDWYLRKYKTAFNNPQLKFR